MTSRGSAKSTKDVNESLAARWRACCDSEPSRYQPIGGSPTQKQRLARAEENAIEQLIQTALPVESRAVAFRQIMELRRCTARDLGIFFAVDPKVVVIAISLLELPAPSGASEPQSAPRSRGRRRGTQAA